MEQTKQDDNKHDEQSPKKGRPKNEKQKTLENKEFKLPFTYPTSKNFYKDQPLCKMDLM